MSAPTTAAAPAVAAAPVKDDTEFEYSAPREVRTEEIVDEVQPDGSILRKKIIRVRKIITKKRIRHDGAEAASDDDDAEHSTVPPSPLYDPSSVEQAAIHTFATTAGQRTASNPATPVTSPKPAPAPLTPEQMTAPLSLDVTAEGLTAHVAFLQQLIDAHATIPENATGAAVLSPATVAALEERYYAWLSFLASGRAATSTSVAAPVPPQDVLAIWHAHVTSDLTRYADDLGALFGTDARDAILAIPLPAVPVALKADEAAWAEATGGLAWAFAPKNTVNAPCAACDAVSTMPTDLYASGDAVCGGCAADVSPASLAPAVAAGRIARASAPLLRFAVDFGVTLPRVRDQLHSVQSQLYADEEQEGTAPSYSLQSAAELALVLRRLLATAAARTPEDTEPLRIDADVLLAYWTAVVRAPQLYLDYSLDTFGKIVVLNQQAVALSAVGRRLSNAGSFQIVVAGELSPPEVEVVPAAAAPAALIALAAEVVAEKAAAKKPSIDDMSRDLDKLEQQVEALAVSPAKAAAPSPPQIKGPSVAALRAMFEGNKKQTRTITVNVPGAVESSAATTDLLSGEALDGHVDLLAAFAGHLSLARHQDKHVEGKVDTLYLVKAERRYYAWLVMLATPGTNAAEMLPPVDVLLLWYNHMTHAPTYHRDLANIFGDECVPEMLRTPFPLRKFLVQSLTRQVDAAAQAAWERFTGMPFVLLHNADVVEHPWLLQCPTCCSYRKVDAVSEFVALRMGNKAIECSVCWRTITKTQLMLMRDPQLYAAFAVFSVDLVRTVQEWRSTVLAALSHLELKNVESKAAAINKYLSTAWRRAVFVTDAEGVESVYHLADGDWSSDVVLAYLTHTLWPNQYAAQSQASYGALADHHTISLAVQDSGVNFHHWDATRGRPLRLRRSAPVAEAAAVSENIHDVEVEDGKNLVEEARLEGNAVLRALSSARFGDMRGAAGAARSVTLTPGTIRKYKQYLLAVGRGAVASIPPVDVAVVFSAHAAHPAEFQRDAETLAGANAETLYALAEIVISKAALNPAHGAATWEAVESAVTVQDANAAVVSLNLMAAAREHIAQLELVEKVAVKETREAYSHYVDHAVVIEDGNTATKEVYSLVARDDAVIAGEIVHSASPAAYAEWFLATHGLRPADMLPPVPVAAAVQALPALARESAPVEVEVEQPHIAGIDSESVQVLQTVRDALIERAVLFNDAVYMTNAVRRYVQYLRALAAGADASVVPPIDVAVLTLAHLASPAAFHKDVQLLGLSQETVAALADPIGRFARGPVDKAAWAIATGLGFDLQPPALLAPPTPNCAECGLAQTADSVAYATGRAQCAGCHARLFEARVLSLHLGDAALEVYRQLTNFGAGWTAQSIAAEYNRYLELGVLIRGDESRPAEFYTVAPQSEVTQLGVIMHAARPVEYAIDFATRFGGHVAETFTAPVDKELPTLPFKILIHSQTATRSATIEVAVPVNVTGVTDASLESIALVRDALIERAVLFNDAVYMTNAVRRYVQYLRALAAGADASVVPPVDIAVLTLAHMSSPAAFQMDMQALGISDETVAAIADPIGRLALGTADKSAWGLATSLGFDLQPPALLAPPTPSCSECGLAQTADSVAYATGRAQCAGCYARLLEKRALSLHLDDVALDVYRQLTDVDSTWTAADLAREHDRFLDLGMVIQNGSGSSAEFYSVGAESDAAKLGHILHAAYPAAYAADFKARFNAAVADTYRAPAEKALPALPAAPRVTVSIGADAAAASAPAVALNVLTASPLEAGFFKSAKAAAVASDLIAADPAAAVAAYEAHVRALASSNGTEPKSESSLVRAVTLAHLLRIESFEQDIAELVGADKAAGIAAELRREVLEDISDVDTTAVAPTGTRSAITLGSLVATLPQLLAVLAEAVQEYTPTPSVAYERVLDNTTVLTREDGAKELYSFQFSQAHMLPHIEHIARGDAYHQYCTTHFDGVVGMLFALPAAPVPEKAPRLVVALATAGQAVVVERSLEVEAAPLVSADQVREFIAYVKPLLAKQTGPIALADVQTYTAEYRSHQGDTAFQLISLVHSMLSARYSRDHVALEDGQDVNGVELTADLNRRLASLRAVLDGVNADNDATAAAARYSRAMKDAVAVTAEDGSKYLYSIAPATPALLVAHLVHLSEPEAYKTFALVQFGTVTDLLVSSEAAFAPVEVVATEDASIEVTEDLSRDLEIVAAALLPAATPRILVDVSSAAAPATAAAAAHADGATETAPITVADVEAFKSHWLANEHEKRFTNLIFALNAIQRFQQWVTLPQAILPPPDVAVVHQVAKALGPNSASLPDAFLAASFLNAVASDADVSKWEHDTGLAWELDISNTYHCNKCQGTITLRSNTEQCLVCHEPLLGSDFAVSMFQKVPAFLVAVDELKRANAAQIVPTYAEWLVNVLLVSDQAGARQLYSIAPLTPEVSAGHLVHTQNGAAYRATMLAKTGGVATLFAPLATKPKAAASAAPRPVSVAATPLPSPVQSPIPAPRAIVIAPRPISRPTTPVKRDMDPVISLNPAALANGFALSNVDAFVIKPARDAAAAGTVEKVLGGEVTAASIDRHWRLLRMLLQIETSHYPALIVRSESRYLKWLTMVSETGKTHLIPPVDVALIAHVHAQFPERQRADLVGLFGETAADALMQLSVLSHEPAQFQQEIDAESEARWESYTGEPYLYHHAKAATAYLVSCPACSTISPASQAAIVSIKSEPNVTLPCGVCEVASDLMALRKTNRGIAAFSLNFVAQVGVWRSRMHKYLNESNQINAADATKQYRDYVRLSTEITLANGVTEVYSMVDSSASVQIGHATHLQFSGAYRKTVLGHFGHAGVTFVKVEEPLPLQPMEDDRRSSFMNIPIPPVPVDSAADVTAATVAVGTRDPNVRKDRSRALSLGTVSSVFEPVPDFSMRPEQLVAFQRLCAALLASPEFAFADDKAADQYWARAEARYLSYMRLMEHTVVEGHALPLPPLDVMTMWLVHIMDSHRYVEDLVRIFGDVKLLKFGFPVEKLDMFLQVNGAGAVMSGAAWKEFVPTSHADTWTTFTGQPFVLDAATVAAEWEMVCPFCRHDQKVAAPLYAEMRTGSRMLFCESCQKFMTPATISAWRLVEDLRKAEKGQGHVGGTLFNFARGKIDYKLAHTVHKLLFFTHDKTITEVLEARLNERDVVNPWKELDLAAILHDYVHAAVEKEYDGKAKELAKKADIVTGKILSYYQNVVTPLSLDLLQARTTWFKLTREVLDHIGEPFGDKEAQTIIDRYTKFMGLLEERRRKTSGTAAGASGDRYKGIVPAVDILLAHRCHLLDPVVYQKYCQSRFGKLMDFSRFTSKAELTAEYHDMAVLWTQKYSTPFDLPFQKPKPAKKKGLKKVLGLFGFGRK